MIILSRGPVPLLGAVPPSGAGGIPDPPSPCKLEINTPDPISERENLVLMVSASPAGNDSVCYDGVTLDAPNFRVAVNQGYFRELAAAKKDAELPDDLARVPPEVRFILAPEKSGRYKIGISSRKTYRILDVAVTNTLGLSPAVAQLLTGVGTILGPMLTVPWWLDRRRERQATVVDGDKQE